MFGIGYQEMFVVLVVAMIVFGPSRLPELAGQVGRWVREFRKMSSDLTGEFEKTFAEVDEVKKSFTRELQSIQDEVDGVGKSARGELKKSATKSAAAGKKAASAGAKPAGAAAVGTSGNGSAAKVDANGARSKMPALQARTKGGVAAKAAADALAATVPLATKADPLADVSFFAVDLVPLKSGFESDGNGTGEAPADDALSRVRRRRAAAGYARRATVS